MHPLSRQRTTEALILVLDASVMLPDEIGGKKLITFGLNKLWGVALP